MQQSVSELHQQYLSRRNLRPASLEVYGRACRFFVAWFGDLPAGEVTPLMAEDYRTMLLRHLGKGSSVANYENWFKPFWAWAARHRYIVSDPFANLPRLVIEEQTRTGFTPEELSQLVRAADDVARIMICMGLEGARRGEMLTTQVGDVHLEKSPPYIELASKKADERTLAWGTKGHRVRIIPVPERIGFAGLLVPFRELLARRLVELDGDPKAYLFAPDRAIRRRLDRQADGTLSYGDIRDLWGNFPRWFRALQRRAGIRSPKRFHELRAAFITAMIDTVGLSRAADLAGHASVEQTRKYDRKQRMELVAEAARVAAESYVTKVS